MRRSRNLMCFSFVVAAFVTLFLAFAACRSHAVAKKTPDAIMSRVATPPPATLGALPIPSLPPASSAPTARSAVPMYHTGIASIDAAIAAVQAHDLESLTRQIRYTKQPCVTLPDTQLSGRPSCKPNESSGDLVDSFLVANCQGAFLASADGVQIENELRRYFDSRLEFYGAYRSPTQWGAGNYTAVFSAGDPSSGSATVALLNDEGIVGVGTGCGSSAVRLPIDSLLGDPIAASIGS